MWNRIILQLSAFDIFIQLYFRSHCLWPGMEFGKSQSNWFDLVVFLVWHQLKPMGDLPLNSRHCTLAWARLFRILQNVQWRWILFDPEHCWGRRNAWSIRFLKIVPWWPTSVHGDWKCKNLWILNSYTNESNKDWMCLEFCFCRITWSYLQIHRSLGMNHWINRNVA